MTRIERNFDSYEVEYFSRKDGADNIPNATITCFDGKEEVGIITFLSGKQIPLCYYENDLIYIFFDLSLFSDILNIVRHEKNLRICVEDTLGSGGIHNKDYWYPEEQKKEVN
jgi:hypothetical protein